MVIVALIVLASILFVTVKLFNPPKFVMFAVVAFIVFVVIFPLTVIALKLPKAVIVFCVPLDKAALYVFAVIFPVTVILFNPPRFVIVAVTTLIAFELILPDTVNAFKLPRLVILFNAVVPKIPLKVPPSMVPGTFRSPINPLTVLNVFDVMLPVTVRLTNPPKLAMFAVVTLMVLADIFPATVRFVKVPSAVMFG